MRCWIDIAESVEVQQRVMDEAVSLFFSETGLSDGCDHIVKAEMGFDPYDQSIDVFAEEHMPRFQALMYDRVAEAEYNITSKFKGGKLTVYRQIVAPEDFVLNGHPGIYWSWEKEAAEAHWGGGDGVLWLITAEVTSADIDWVATLAHNASIAYEYEREIRIYKSANPHVLGVERAA